MARSWTTSCRGPARPIRPLVAGMLACACLAVSQAPAASAATPDSRIDAEELGVAPYVENPGGGGVALRERSVPGGSTARRPRSFLRGFAEPNFEAADASTRDAAFDAAVRAGAGIVRINVPWRSTVSGTPAVPADPADPAYRFGSTDEAVREANERGLQVILTVFSAPDFAEGQNRPGDAPAGTWKPDPAALAAFAQALATRYSGTFMPLGTLAPLPRVAYFEAWNEPNLSEYLTPQFVKGDKPFAPDLYRALLNAVYDGIKASANPGAQVLFGGTGPYGDPVGQRRTRPLRFMREVFCLNGRLERTCSERTNFEVMSHHPISFADGPNHSATHPDDAAMADLDEVVSTIRAAERRKTVTGGKHPVWATEVWWETDPPDDVVGVSLGKHARWVAESLHTLWEQGAEVVIWLQVVDTPAHGEDGVGGYQTGLVDAAGADKPAFQAFRFPFVVDRSSKKRARVWFIAPTSGTVEIQEKTKSGFETVARIQASAGDPVQKGLKVSRKAALRAAIGGEVSRTYAGR